MDDLKTSGKNDQEQTGLLTIVKGFLLHPIGVRTRQIFQSYIQTRKTYHYWKLPNWPWHHDPTTKHEGTYKYLGMNEGDDIQQVEPKWKKGLEKSNSYRRIRMVTKSELSAINRVDAINTLATTVVSYSFNIVDRKMEEIKNYNRRTRNYSS